LKICNGVCFLIGYRYRASFDLDLDSNIYQIEDTSFYERQERTARRLASDMNHIRSLIDEYRLNDIRSGRYLGYNPYLVSV